MYTEPCSSITSALILIPTDNLSSPHCSVSWGWCPLEHLSPSTVSRHFKHKPILLPEEGALGCLILYLPSRQPNTQVLAALPGATGCLQHLQFEVSEGVCDQWCEMMMVSWLHSQRVIWDLKDFRLEIVAAPGRSSMTHSTNQLHCHSQEEMIHKY